MSTIGIEIHASPALASRLDRLTPGVPAEHVAALRTALAALVTPGGRVALVQADGDAPALRQTSFDSLAPGAPLPWPDGRFDVILVCHADGRIEPLTLLADAYARLGEAGHLVFLDDFRTPAPRATTDQTPRADHVIRAARRAGFELVDDLTWPHTPTHETRLMTLRRAGPPRWQLRPFRPDDKPAIQALFTHTFGTTMSDALWAWKYGEGRGFGIAAWAGDDAVGFLGGFVRTARWRDRELMFLQLGEAMVRKDFRGSLVYRDLTASWYERTSGYQEAGPLAYGFVAARHGARTTRWGIVSRVTEIQQIVWPMGVPRHFEPFRRRRLSWPRDAAAVDGLWRMMQHDLADQVVGVRDAAYLQHRFLDHPDIAYEVYVVERERSRRAEGVFVLKRHGEFTVLVDVVAPLARLPVLVRQALRIATAAGKPLMSWVDAGHAPLFTDTGGIPESFELDVVSTDGPFRREEVTNPALWWLLMGDFDYL